MSRNNSKKRARVLIVDDHPAVREALAMRIGLQSDLEVCGEAADLSEALRWSPTHSPTWPLSISPSRPAAAST